jgi:shikimate dehydrogenase
MGYSALPRDILAGVIGSPTAHSKSPLIHNYWLQRSGLSGEYKALDIAPGDLAYSIEALKNSNLKGFNVTIPHKEQILTLCDTLERSAVEIGAVNSVKIDRHKLIGSNTDAFGFIENIRQFQPHFDFSGQPAMVLGAGGAARAVIYGLLQEGVPEILLSNRTIERAEKLAQDFSQICVIEWANKQSCLSQVKMLINTTSLGMNGQPPLQLDISKLPQDALVTDLVYNPLDTPLLKAAKARYYTTITGIGMLAYQAQKSFHDWFGILPPVDEKLFEILKEKGP